MNQRKRFEGTTLLALKTEDRGCKPRSAGSFKELKREGNRLLGASERTQPCLPIDFSTIRVH